MVKIDAEGAELSVLHGMQRLLTESSPILAVETGDYEGMASPRTSTCLDFLAAFDYRPYEYAGSLQPHQRRDHYGYGNLFFPKSP